MSTTNEPAAVEVSGLTKFYGKVRALDDVDVSIGSGEYFVLLGPSGGGKTTLLRLIGGFIKPSSGSVKLRGDEVSHLPPEKRPTSMVFQSYALFPHMTVEQNVGYGLKLRKIPSGEAAQSVKTALEQVSMTGYESRKPWELSGGQQQRVQLARALVLKPQILLLDEPLAALDAQLRKDMCYELKHLQESVGITFIHVTHNQEEAMTVADRIAVIADGKLVEQGNTRQIYEQPKDRFTASFVGERNLFDGKVVSAPGATAAVDLGIATIQAPQLDSSIGNASSVIASVRSESMRIHNQPVSDEGMVSAPATVQEQVYLGLTTQTLLTLSDGQQISTREIGAGATHYPAGAAVHVAWPMSETAFHSS
ncbi:MAG: ABC transporter ATP-binding protein [Burkholderiaceae bacterium]